MSEYQYYEFRCFDSRLSDADRTALRALSTRAQITATSFTNSYSWGDFKGDPKTLMERWFDLHLYLANWGSRRFMVKLPARLVDRTRCEAMLTGIDGASIVDAGENYILDVCPDEMEPPEIDEGGEGLLDGLAPLRDDLLAGDLRLLYLLWLREVEAGTVDDDAPEPLPGLGPLSDPLSSFADFFYIGSDFVESAAERNAFTATDAESDARAARALIDAMPHNEKSDYLMRLIDGDAHVAAELRVRVRRTPIKSAISTPRTAGELRMAVQARRDARLRAKVEKEAAEQKRREAEAERHRRDRLAALERDGERAWSRLEVEIEQRSEKSYERAAFVLFDLAALAAEKGEDAAFRRKLDDLRARHARKGRLLARLAHLK